MRVWRFWGLGVQGLAVLGFRVEGLAVLGFRVEGLAVLGFRVRVWGFWGLGFGLRVEPVVCQTQVRD